MMGAGSEAKAPSEAEASSSAEVVEMGAGTEATAPAEAKAYSWAEAQAQAEEEARDMRVSLIQEKIQRLTLAMMYGDFSGMSEAERAAKQARDEEERLALLQELDRLFSESKGVDYSGMTEAERAAEAERRRQIALQEARRLQMEGHPMDRRREALARILDFDPKQDGVYYNRCSVNLPDLDEESPLGPMRFPAVRRNKNGYDLCEAVNILSVKIACSDVGFPIHVYGTVIARDCIDEKCVYLFRRDCNNCQLINSKDESLILTGPKRGLALLDDNYVETDLKIKDHLGQDRELSKGVITIGSRSGPLEECVVGTESLATRLGTVDLMYAVVKCALEATIAVELLQGDFCAKITAYTTNMKKRLVLYDSKVADAMTGHDCGVIQLIRSVISVYVKDMLIVAVQTSDIKSELAFTPRVNSRDDAKITVGATRMHVKVAWSVMNPW